MPVIIDEVVISIETGPASANAGNRVTGTSVADDHQQMVAECVEQVLEILQHKAER
jgi:hypothetical protein